MYLKLFSSTFLLLLSFSQLTAQIGGQYVYDFLNLPASARAAALGGAFIAVKDDDPSLSLQNPALLNKEMSGFAGLSAVGYHGEAFYSNAFYVTDYKENAMLQFNLQYMDYGSFELTDEAGNQLGRFNAGELALSVNAAQQLNEQLHLGVGLTVVNAAYESYHSLGVGANMALLYHSEDELFAATVNVRQLGYQVIAFDENREPMPLDVQVGVSKKFENMPLRFSVVAHNLHRPDLTYDDPFRSSQIDLATGNRIQDEIPFSERIFRHMIFAGELVFSPNFHLRIGYNHMRRKEMAIENRQGLVGFSWGFGMRVKKFHIHYGSGAYHLSGMNNHFTLATNLNRFFKND